MAWVYFQNQAAWDAYHNQVCAAEGIPRPGRRQSDRVPMILAQWTDAWANPVQFKAQGNVTSWVAHVPDEDVITYGLGGIVIPDSAVVSTPFSSTITVTIGSHTYTAEPTTMTWRKVKPPTYTIDGVTYDTTTGLPV